MQKKDCIERAHLPSRCTNGGTDVEPVARTLGDPSQDFELLAQRLFDLVSDERDGLNGDHSTEWTAFSSLVGSESTNRLLGILATCAITGCDVHLISKADAILRHVADDERMPKPFEWARQFLATSPPDIIAVLVFESSNKLLCLDGTLRPAC